MRTSRKTAREDAHQHVHAVAFTHFFAAAGGQAACARVNRAGCGSAHCVDAGKVIAQIHAVGTVLRYAIGVQVAAGTLTGVAGAEDIGALEKTSERSAFALNVFNTDARVAASTHK